MSAPRRLGLVTGGSSGIGLAIARDIASLCETVMLVARSERNLREAARAIGGPSEIRFAPTDLTKADERAALASAIEREFGGLDVLVHAAGAFAQGPWTTEIEDEVLELNYVAPAALTMRLLPLLKSAGGQVVFVNSTQGLQPGQNSGRYAVSKLALRAFADTLRSQVNPDGIRVLTVYAGSTATAMQERIHAEDGRRYEPDRLMQPEDVASIVGAALRLPKTAEVIELVVRPMKPPGRPRPGT